MKNLIEDIDRLLAMRRAAKDEEDKAALDRAIAALIETRSPKSATFPTPYTPPAPPWTLGRVMCECRQ